MPQLSTVNWFQVCKNHSLQFHARRKYVIGPVKSIVHYKYGFCPVTSKTNRMLGGVYHEQGKTNYCTDHGIKQFTCQCQTGSFKEAIKHGGK